MRLAASLSFTCLSLSGCAQELTDLQGVLVHGPDGDEVVVGADIITLDDQLNEVAATTSDEVGWYRVAAPAGQRTFVQVHGEGLVHASFSGTAGLNPRQRVPVGELFSVSDALMDAWQETWAGCPGADSGEGWMIGEVQALDWRHEDGTPFIIEQASVVVKTQQGTVQGGCYLDGKGEYSDSAVETGITGRFLVANLPPGQHVAEVTWAFAGTAGHRSLFEVHIPEGGVAPRWPLFMEFVTQ